MVVVPIVDLSIADDETELVVLAQKDRHEFATLYRRYLPQVYGYCYRRLDSQEAAEDATSQVFAQALSALPRFEHRGGTFRSWLFTIAHNVVIDEGRRMRPSLPLEAAGRLVADVLSLDEVAIREEEQQTVATLLRQLPLPQRQVVELRMAGLNGVEIAAVLGRSHGAIRKLQYRTLLRLRDMLQVADTRKEARDAS